MRRVSSPALHFKGDIPEFDIFQDKSTFEFWPDVRRGGMAERSMAGLEIV